MYKNTTAVERGIRKMLFDNIRPNDAFCFSLDTPIDASVNQLGDLFEQNDDFFILEVETDGVVPAGASKLSPRIMSGGIEIRYLSKNRMDDLGAKARLEEIGEWFAQQTVGGIHFYEYFHSGYGRLLGFQRYTGTIPFDCEIQPKEQK